MLNDRWQTRANQNAPAALPIGVRQSHDDFIMHTRAISM